MSIFEYNEAEALKAIKADEYAFGVQDGIAQSIGMVIETYAELGISRQDTSKKVMEKFGLGKADVKKYMDEYWK